MFTEIWGGAAWFSQRSFFLSFVLFYPSTPSDMLDIQISFGRKWSTRDQKPKSSLWSKLAFDSTLKAHTTTTVASFTHEEPINQHKENIFPTFPVALFFTNHPQPALNCRKELPLRNRRDLFAARPDSYWITTRYDNGGFKGNLGRVVVVVVLVMVMLLTSWFIWSMLYGDCLVLCYHQRRRPCSHLKLQRGMPVARLMDNKFGFFVCLFIYFNHSWRLKEKKSYCSLSELREEGYLSGILSSSCLLHIPE